MVGDPEDAIAIDAVCEDVDEKEIAMF